MFVVIPVVFETGLAGSLNFSKVDCVLFSKQRPARVFSWSKVASIYSDLGGEKSKSGFSKIYKR
jgi:hypothetical protein